MVDIGKREDLMLEKLQELIRNRDNTIRTCEALAEADPELAEIMDFILLGLR